jgi:hypothetical protein
MDRANIKRVNVDLRSEFLGAPPIHPAHFHV